MKYQKIIYLLDNTPNHPSKSRTKNWVKINDDPHGMSSTNSQIKFKVKCESPVYVITVIHRYVLKES